MKRILFNSAIICMCIGLAGVAQAQSYSRPCATKKPSMFFQPYLGVEYQYEHIKPSKAYRGFLSANFQYSNFFVGTRIGKYLGAEVGYYLNLKNNQQQNTTYVFNGQPAGGLTATLTNSKYKGFSADLAAYYQVDSNFHASAIFGVMTMHPSLEFKATNNTNLARGFVLLSAKNRTVPRLGFGLELLTKHWGCRTRMFWVYTQSVKLNASAAQAVFPALSANPYVQAVMATAGVFFRF